eukprot:scaffold38423_cov51-Attheya_sp.AAC.8
MAPISMIAPIAALVALAFSTDAFSHMTPASSRVGRNAMHVSVFSQRSSRPLFMSEDEASQAAAVSVPEGEDEDEEMMDAGTRLQLEKIRRSEELRSQEVFMTKSTGKHKCGNCDWEFDEAKGDSFMIGGQIQPGTKFADLPSNYRCPTCRASKDNFEEIVTEIPGFEVNQGYGLGGNGMSSESKSGIIFGGLFVFFVLFLAGYGLS